MYYDPMISKLITWGKDRKEALDLIDKAFDEYVVQGVRHNIGFGKSIVHNESFKAADYSTAFIPTFYPDGFHGESLKKEQKQNVALAAFQLKNIFSKYYAFNEAEKAAHKGEKVLYISILGKNDDPVTDWRVENTGTHLKVTNLSEDGETEAEFTLDNFNFTHNSLVKFGLNGQE